MRSTGWARPLDRLGLTLRTVRYLRPEQAVARGRFIAERAVVRARPGLLERRYGEQLAAIERDTREGGSLWQWPPAPFDPAARADLDQARRVMQGRFVFLNQPRKLHEPVDWQPRDTSRLWRFHLHSFGYAVDLAAAARRGEQSAYERLRSLVEQWLACHPTDERDAWHPFVVSNRLVAWQVARDLLRPELVGDPSFDGRLRSALLKQAAFLSEHLETDVGGNHLLKNLVALLLVGCAFEGSAPAAWRDRAGGLLDRELRRQVLADGGHYERSPMYHLLVLADLFVALRASGRRELPVSVSIAAAVRHMQRFASTLRHPDGEIPLFNDAVIGEAPPPAALLGPSTEAAADDLVESGYFLLPLADPSPGGVLIADCGAPGPDDLPAHVHADALSFELSVGHRRVIVDGGVLNYEPGAMRDYFRGTAAHNTVQVGGAHQSEVWGTFRVGERARVRLEHWAADGERRRLVGSHDGYARRGVRHVREICAEPGSGWRVQDTLFGRGEHVAASRLRLHPDLRWRVDDRDYLALDVEGTLVLRVRPFGAVGSGVERGIYAPRFNQPRDVQVLVLRHAGPLPAVFGYWLLLPGGRPVLV